MKKGVLITGIIILIPIVLYLLLSLFTGSFCPPSGWQGPFPPWCEKPSQLGNFEYRNLDYIENSNPSPKTNKILMGIGLADLWGNPHIVIDMGEDNRKLVSSTMERLKSINSDSVLLTDFAIYDSDFNVQKATSTNAAGAFEITESELKEIVKKAKENNQNQVFLTVNLYDPGYIYGKWLGQNTKDSAYIKLVQNPSKETLDKLWQGWEVKILEEAEKAQVAGVDYLVINPTDTNLEYYFDLSQLNEKYLDLIPKVREKFKGKIGFFGSLPRLASDKITATEDVDFTIISFDVNGDYLGKEIFKNTPENLDQITSSFNSWLSNPNWQNIKSDEIYISILIPSYDGAIQNGWIEPAKGDNSWTKDWKEQALAYEGLFQAIYSGNYKIDGLFSYGYWWSDNIYPDSKDIRTDLTHTIRQKDAENVFNRWTSIVS